jgi:hypothetical protein
MYEILLNPKRNETLLFGITWMEAKIIILSEINQEQKGKYYTISLICGILRS